MTAPLAFIATTAGGGDGCHQPSQLGPGSMPSRSINRARWASMVRMLSPNSWAIILLVFPAARRSATLRPQA